MVGGHHHHRPHQLLIFDGGAGTTIMSKTGQHLGIHSVSGRERARMESLQVSRTLRVVVLPLGKANQVYHLGGGDCLKKSFQRRVTIM
jgi:hypothetical protein